MKLPPGIYYVFDLKNYVSNKDTIYKNMDNINLSTGKYWEAYRLSDTICGKNHNFNKEQIAVKWPNSFIDLYHKNIDSQPEKKRNFDIINKIIIENFPIHITEPYIAIHLRFGDRLNRWTHPLLFYEELNLEQYNCKNIIIFCGTHNGAHTSSISYLKQVANILKNRGYHIIIRAGNSPDDDFVLMCKSKYFISGGGGGYTELISKMINYYK